MREHSSTATMRPNRWSPWRNPLEATRAWQSCRIWWRTPRSRCGVNWLDSKLPFVVILLPFSRRVSALRLASLTILSGWVWYKAGSKEMVMKPLKFLAIMRWWWHRHCRSGSCFNCYSDFCAQVSVGLENCQDLIADLDQALRTAIKCWQKW